ncbi:MAG: hypothetical protein ABF289_09320 [Clostridiales bacterium]
MKVLFLASNPKDTGRLRIDVEIREIEEKIKLSKYRSKVELIPVMAVRPKDLLQSINEHNPDVLHFSGHGTDDGDIILEDEAGNPRYVRKEALIQMIKFGCDNLKMVVLDCCYSKIQADEIVKHIDVVIGMEGEVDAKVGRHFSSQFYSAIGFGKSLKVAFEQAKALVMAELINAEKVLNLVIKDGIDSNKYFLVNKNKITEEFGTNKKSRDSFNLTGNAGQINIAGGNSLLNAEFYSGLDNKTNKKINQNFASLKSAVVEVINIVKINKGIEIATKNEIEEALNAINELISVNNENSVNKMLIKTSMKYLDGLNKCITNEKLLYNYINEIVSEIKLIWNL